LVTCFGYLGYKNARFGRIEAHQAVTAYGREALLRAKEAAEDMGYEALHLYVDALWVRQPGKRSPEDFQPLLEEIQQRTGLPLGLDGVYRWLVFLPSRVDPRWPVANRYFGVFQDGSLKVRGIEARRRDTPDWIARCQMGLLETLASMPEPEDALPAALARLRGQLADLRRNKVPPHELLVRLKLSRKLEEYRTPSASARAALQLRDAGKQVRPGQRVSLLLTRGEAGVFAWDLPCPDRLPALDIGRYETLLLRAASSVLGPFGWGEDALRARMCGGLQGRLFTGMAFPGLSTSNTETIRKNSVSIALDT
jgi:DNA polymerase-2